MPETENGIQDTRGRTHQLSVSQMMDPALNHRAFPDAPLNVTDAINAGNIVQGWGNNSGVGPGTRGYRGSVGQEEEETEGDGMSQPQLPAPPFRTGRPASEVSGNTRRFTSNIRPLNPSFYAKGGPVPPGKPFVAGDPQEDGKPNPELVMPHPSGGHDVIPLKHVPHYAHGTRHRSADRDTRAPMSKAGRTSGLSSFYNNQSNLGLENSARGSVDPVSGLSQTPTQREINDLLHRLASKGDSEIPGFGGLEQAALMQRYFHAKQSGDPQLLAATTAQVVDFKNRLNALRGQQEGYSPSIAEAVGRTARMAPTAPVVPVEESQESYTPPIIPGLSPQGRTASLADKSISTPYGKGSVTFAPRAAPAVFNVSGKYDPNFKQKAQSMADASAFEAVKEAQKPEGMGFEAVTPTPQQELKYGQGLTAKIAAQSAQEEAARQKGRDAWEAEKLRNEAAAIESDNALKSRSRFEENITDPIARGAGMVGDAAKGAFNWAFGSRPRSRTGGFVR